MREPGCSVSASAPAVAAVATTERAALDADAHPEAAAHPEHDGPRERDARTAREAAWVHALAEMERVADHAEDLLRVARSAEPEVAVALTEPWTTPRGLGPLPVTLAPRAAALVERQRDLVRRTAEQLGEHRRRLRTSDGLRTRAAAAPVYLDVEG
ncbi:hypothetical protein [Cellulomonas endometrii]|uniref:hypothetical protein n=1 Tax=Cellulomonas endometrii TaxID=3036301 RepID=UPI001B9A0F6C|nr:hypothetical protein [Cellulomonas endometrii]VTR77533.1 hypothetical protein CHMI_02303 [Cellulomonas hominis]